MSDVERIFEDVRNNLPLERMKDLHDLLMQEISVRQEQMGQRMWNSVIGALKNYVETMRCFSLSLCDEEGEIHNYTAYFNDSSKLGVLELDVCSEETEDEIDYFS